jgi:ABC-type uncharacterized transport system substrate-binding protein
VIADSWSVDELKDAEVLADLEGWGQVKRLVAKLCAEIHNVGILGRYFQSVEQGPPPKMLSESAFLPKKIYKLNIAKTEVKQKATETIQQQASSFISSMAGF